MYDLDYLLVRHRSCNIIVYKKGSNKSLAGYEVRTGKWHQQHTKVPKGLRELVVKAANDCLAGKKPVSPLNGLGRRKRK